MLNCWYIAGVGSLNVDVTVGYKYGQVLTLPTQHQQSTAFHDGRRGDPKQPGSCRLNTYLGVWGVDFWIAAGEGG